MKQVFKITFFYQKIMKNGYCKRNRIPFVFRIKLRINFTGLLFMRIHKFSLINKILKKKLYHWVQYQHFDFDRAEINIFIFDYKIFED